jgi:hypothetical protein
MACVFLYLSPRSILPFEKIQILFWNLFLNHFKILPFKALVWICIFKSIFKSSRFENSLESLFKFILVWFQLKFNLKIFKPFDFGNQILESKIWNQFLQPIIFLPSFRRKPSSRPICLLSFPLEAGPVGPRSTWPTRPNPLRPRPPDVQGTRHRWLLDKREPHTIVRREAELKCHRLLSFFPRNYASERLRFPSVS